MPKSMVQAINMMLVSVSRVQEHGIRAIRILSDLFFNSDRHIHQYNVNGFTGDVIRQVFSIQYHPLGVPSYMLPS